MLQRLKAWWKSRYNYCYEVPSARRNLYSAYYYPNRKCLEFTAPQHGFTISKLSDIDQMLKYFRGEFNTAYSKAYNKPIKKVTK